MYLSRIVQTSIMQGEYHVSGPLSASSHRCHYLIDALDAILTENYAIPLDPSVVKQGDGRDYHTCYRGHGKYNVCLEMSLTTKFKTPTPTVSRLIVVAKRAQISRQCIFPLISSTASRLLHSSTHHRLFYPLVRITAKAS